MINFQRILGTGVGYRIYPVIIAILFILGGCSAKTQLDNVTASDNTEKVRTMRVDNAPYQGAAQAPVTIIEYTDYQCPYCRQFAFSTKFKLYQQYIKTGKVRYLSRQYPLTKIHPHAFKAAEAALCANDQGMYWKMQEILFSGQNQLALEHLYSHAASIGLNNKQYQQCLDSGQHARQVESDVIAGKQAGVHGTPSFFIGVPVPNDPDAIRVVKYFHGAPLFQQFQQIIDKLIQQKGQLNSEE